MAPAPCTLCHPLFSHQPLTTIYKLIRTLTLLAKLPVWLVKALVPGLRPTQRWTFKQALMRNLIYDDVDQKSIIGITEAQSLEPGEQGARWAVLEPFAPTLYVGPAVDSSGRVTPARIGGTWYGRPSAPANADDARRLSKVALYTHGGAFVTFNGRDDNCGNLAGLLTDHAGYEAVFAPQYRLSGYQGRDPFPAALQDAVTSYLHLIKTLGIKPESITIVGDSAGGNLALALLRYLERFGGQIDVPKPAYAVLLSPWVKPSAGLHTNYESWQLSRTDFLASSFLKWGADAYIKQATDVDEGSEWVDPLGHPFETDVPVFLNWASGEILSVDCAKWADEWRRFGEARKGAALRFETNVEVDAPHDTLLVSGLAGWDESAQDVARKIKTFVGN